MTISHVFSVDVEEYFQVQAFESHIPVTTWDSYPLRVDIGLEKIFSYLERNGSTATFFVVGWLAERRPQIVTAIVDRGHEVASHGYMHRRVDKLGPTGFREDLRRSRNVLEQISGTQLLGFRAPSFSIQPSMSWAFEILAEEGFVYDSSVFPSRRPRLTYSAVASTPYNIDCGDRKLLEIPMSSWRWSGIDWPAAGGNYLRQLPPFIVDGAVAQHEARSQSAVIYVHPWELDPAQPVLDVSRLVRLRHYRGLAEMEFRVQGLLSRHKFRSIRDIYMPSRES